TTSLPSSPDELTVEALNHLLASGRNWLSGPVRDIEIELHSGSERLQIRAAGQVGCPRRAGIKGILFG
ncbi:MAG: hypothetical protein O6922_07490, partial [Chloroflexi bacterium]|nr:hypothetical protein [Chloroflexota bacterium]